MSFERFNFENTIEKEEENTYKKARKQADILLENIDFAKDEEIVEINPEKPKDDVPVFISPGWGVEKANESMKQTLEIIANEKRKVMTTSFERENKIIENKDKEDIPIAELQKALTIIEAINKKNIDKTDAIGHSEGGLNLAIAASLYPEKFRNLVFLSPAGMMGKKDSFLDLIKRFTVDEGVNEIKNRENSNINSFYDYVKNIIKYVSKNPSLAIEEAKEINSTDIFKMFEHLKEQGVGVGLVCGANDKVFPIEEVIKNANEKNVDYLVLTKGHHGSFVLNEDHVLLAENLLTNMARNKESKSD
ncbi:MAG TPA: alpha/beta hydrolase [Candidatus Pacearchaeota archaeon]|nr:alpha/beta hydrolase [Candidatus Pacearchaeota archaeon]